MIRFLVEFHLPWYKSDISKISKSYLIKHGKLSKNKFWEIDVYRTSFRDLFSCDLDLSFVGRDHAGVQLTLILFGYTVNFNVYDHRHWNYEENRWMIYDEDNE